MKKWLLSLLTILTAGIPQVGFAQGTSWFHFGPPTTDVSLTYLCKIFGSVSGALTCQGNPVTVFSKMFQVLNLGMLTIAGFILIATVIKAVTESTAEGAQLGERRVSHMNVIRVVLGNVLLVPGASGYSILNAIVLWLVIQGVGFADMAWSRVLIYLQSGGVIYSTQSQGGGRSVDPYAMDNTFIFAGVQSDPTTASATDVFNTVLCEETLRKFWPQLLNKVIVSPTVEGIRSAYKSNPTDGNKVLQDFMGAVDNLGAMRLPLAVLDPTAGTYASPIVPSTYTSDYDALNHLASTYGNFNGLGSYDRLNGVCGQYSMKVNPKSTSPSDVNKAAALTATKTTAFQHALNNLRPNAQILLGYLDTYLTDPDASGASQRLDNAISNYQPVLQAAITAAANSYYTEIKSAWMDYEKPTPPAAPSGGVTAVPPLCQDLTGEVQTLCSEGWVSGARYFINLLTSGNAAGVAVSASDAQINILPPSSGSSGLKSPYPFSDVQSQANRSSKFSAFKIQFLKDTFTQTIDHGSSLNDYVSQFGDKFPNLVKAGTDAGTAALAAAQVQPSGGGQVQGPGFTPSVGPSGGWLAGVITSSIAIPGGIALGYYTPGGYGMIPGVALIMYGITSLFPYTFMYLMALVVEKWNDEMASSDTPLEKLKAIGDQMIWSAADFWKSFFAVTTVVMSIGTIGMSVLDMVNMGLGFGSYWGITSGTVANFANQTQQIQGLLSLIFQLLTMYLPAGIAFSLPLLVMGVTLSIYVPLIPFMLFTFGVIGWLIFVIEAMAAAAVIALGITHPEGHPLLGRSEAALNLLMGVFLRPVLMIVGLVAGMVLSYIAIDILNYGFSYLVNTTYHSFDVASGAGQFNIIKQIAVMLIYTFTVVSLINQSFSLIFRVPDQFLTYIGGQPMPGGAEMMQMVGEIKAETKAGMEAHGGAITKGAEVPGAHKPQGITRKKMAPSGEIGTGKPPATSTPASQSSPSGGSGSSTTTST